MAKRIFKPLPLQSEIARLFIYNEVQGALYWKTRPLEDFANKKAFSTWNGRYAGKRAGNKRPDGYIDIEINKVRYRAHRLIFVLLNGDVLAPCDEIDHPHGVERGNFNWNMRKATTAINMRNVSMKGNNKSGITGVHWASTPRKWVAGFMFSGKAIHVGSFDSKTEAAEAVRRARLSPEYGFTARHGTSKETK